MQALFDPLTFSCGARMPNRFMLAPMTNRQSHEDGRLSDDEFRWLTMRATGGFGLTMTCAVHVMAGGKGFPGQLGLFADSHMPGHTRLSNAIQAAGSLSVVQLYHGGLRCPAELIEGPPRSPSDHEKHGSKALAVDEIKAIEEAFVAAAVRAEQAGYSGVELHAAHGYLLCQFLSPQYNQRTDAYGGSLENRSRLLFAIIDGIRQSCKPSFLLGVRMSPEGFQIPLAEAQQLARMLIDCQKLDFLDVSLWDSFKEPADEAYQGRSLLSYFTEIPRHNVRLTVAGKLHHPKQLLACMEAGVDFVSLGKVGILHHDYPQQLQANPQFSPVNPPVSSDYLKSQGLSETFVTYMKRWKGFVETETSS